MTASQFDCVVQKLSGHTEYIYFHLLGEPLTHPKLPELLHIAAQGGMNCCITTNGTLLAEKSDILMNAERLYKLSVSLHSFEANACSGGLNEYLEDVWSVCSVLAKRGTICALRLWNDGGEDRLNGAILDFLREKCGCEWSETRMGGFLLADNLYLENAARFDWPDSDAPERDVEFCHGLRDQIGILCDGTVVPCCLDAEGSIALGNIFNQSLSEILQGARAKALYDGFSGRTPSEELCRRCGYATRFNLNKR